MTPVWIDLVFGWAAVLSALATLGTFATALLFFAVHPSFGPVNDAISVIQAILMMPVAVGMALLTYPIRGGLALLALGVGLLGMILVAVLQTLLVARAVRFDQTIAKVLSAGAAMGLWLIVSNGLGLGGALLPWGLALLGMFAGAGYLLSTIGFHLGGQQHPLFYVGSLLTVVGYSGWALWLGRLVQTGALTLGSTFG